jgi:hypothetical protein
MADSRLEHIGDGKQLLSRLEEVLATETQRVLFFITDGNPFIGRLFKYGVDPLESDKEGFIFRDLYTVHSEMAEDSEQIANHAGAFTPEEIKDAYLFLGGKKLFPATNSWEDETAIYQKHGFSDLEWSSLNMCHLPKVMTDHLLDTPIPKEKIADLDLDHAESPYNLRYSVFVSLAAGDTEFAKICLYKFREAKLKENEGYAGQREMEELYLSQKKAAESLKTLILDRYDEVKDRLVAALQEMDKLRVEKYGYRSLLELTPK